MKGSTLGRQGSSMSLGVSSTGGVPGSAGAAAVAAGGPSFKYFLSSDVKLPVRVKIESLEGHRPYQDLVTTLKDPYLPFSGRYARGYPDLAVTAQLWANGKPLGIPARTPYVSFENDIRWNQWLTLPVKYSDLPLHTQVVLTVWDVYAPRKIVPVGGTTYSLFGKNRTLKKGRHKLVLWEGVEGDGAVRTKTPGKWRQSPAVDRVEKLVKRYERGELPKADWLDPLTFSEITRMTQQDEQESNRLFLYLQFPTFEHPVLFQEREDPAPAGTVAKPLEARKFVIFSDPEMLQPNPVETKHRKLARGLHRRVLDRDLKPNADERNRIARILNAPATRQLSPEEKDLFWKFRHSLIRETKALTKFLRCVDWNDMQESKHAVELMREWAPIDFADALELLSRDFTSEPVRKYAVQRIDEAGDDMLQMYLLQLVQAIRYDAESSPLARFLIDRCCKSVVLATYLHWFLSVECRVESEENNFRGLFFKVREHFLAEVQLNPRIAEMIQRQGELVAQLSAITRELKNKNDSRPKKVERLRSLLSPLGMFEKLSSFPPLRLPLKPEVQVTGVIADRAYIFRSALSPIRIEFEQYVEGPGHGVNQTPFTIIYKAGDDLRQDQLIIQLISLMDTLLKKERLDLQLTPYRVLATSSTSGMVEFVPTSQPFAKVVSEHRGDVQAFFRENHPNPSGPYGIEEEVLDRYIKSCAGYCVLTYVLGIGDRHLDNVLLTTDGRLTHIDFGYVFGRDPKPFPPPFKLSKEMVLAMGGADSKHYEQFKGYACEAYNILRKSSRLILNLLVLMMDANIPDLSIEPTKAILKVAERFRMDLTDEESVAFFQGLIAESVSALFPQIAETIHRLVQLYKA